MGIGIYNFKGFSLQAGFYCLPLQKFILLMVFVFLKDGNMTMDIFKKQPYLMEAERLVVHRKSQYV